MLHFSLVWPQPCQQSCFRACASERSMLLVGDAFSSFNLEHVLFFPLVCLFLRLSGFMLPSPIVSSGSILALWFTTDFAVSAQGFKAVYEGKACVWGCACDAWRVPPLIDSFHLHRTATEACWKKTKQDKTTTNLINSNSELKNGRVFETWCLNGCCWF